MRYIDAFNHFFPSAFFQEMLQTPAGSKDLGKRMRGIPAVHDIDVRRRVVDEFDDYTQVLSLGLPPAELLVGSEQSPELNRIGNDGLAELVAKYPDRFVGYAASLPMDVPDAAAREAERVLAAGANALQLFTNVKGLPLDDPRFLPIFEIAAKAGRPILLHPVRTPATADYASETFSRYEIWTILGWPYETSVAMARLVFSGVLDRFPDLKVVTHHLGAMIPYFSDRIRYGWHQLGTRTSDEDLGAVAKRMKKPVIEYFKGFYGDTALCGSRASVVCGLDFFGADHVLFATDCPFDPEGGRGFIREVIAVMESLDLAPDAREKICFRNAERLFGLGNG
ncbi:MAG: amidohydrolase family protein [Xanthobacteraceae bacterium]